MDEIKINYTLITYKDSYCKAHGYGGSSCFVDCSDDMESIAKWWAELEVRETASGFEFEFAVLLNGAKAEEWGYAERLLCAELVAQKDLLVESMRNKLQAAADAQREQAIISERNNLLAQAAAKEAMEYTEYLRLKDKFEHKETK